MELVEPRGWHRHGRSLRSDIPGNGIPRGEPLGTTGSVPLPLRHAGLLYSLYRLPRTAFLRTHAQAGAGRSSLRVERTTAPLGPCCHLLAHCRLLLSADTHSTTHPRLLGLGTLLVRVAVCHCRHHHQFYPTEGAL